METCNGVSIGGSPQSHTKGDRRDCQECSDYRTSRALRRLDEEQFYAEVLTCHHITIRVGGQNLDRTSVFKATVRELFNGRKRIATLERELLDADLTIKRLRRLVDQQCVTGECEQVEAENKRLQAEVERLRDLWVNDIRQHQPACESLYAGACNCGLADFRRTLAADRQESEDA